MSTPNIAAAGAARRSIQQRGGAVAGGPRSHAALPAAKTRFNAYLSTVGLPDIDNLQHNDVLPATTMMSQMTLSKSIKTLSILMCAILKRLLGPATLLLMLANTTSSLVVPCNTCRCELLLAIPSREGLMSHRVSRPLVPILSILS